MTIPSGGRSAIFFLLCNVLFQGITISWKDVVEFQESNKFNTGIEMIIFRNN